MVSSNRTILKNTVFLYFRMFVIMLVSLFTVRVVLRTLGVVDYGVYSVIGGVIASIAFISDVLANASQRFFSVEIGKGDPTSLKKTFNLVFLVYCIAGLLILVLSETVGLWFLNAKMDIPLDRMEAANWVYQFVILSFLVSLVSSPFQSMIIANERMNIYAYMSILEVVLKLAIVYLLVVFSVDKLKLYAVLMFAVTLINRMIYVTISRYLFKETKFEFVWDTHGFKSIFGYSTWILIGSLSFVVNTQGVNILLNLFFGPMANAAYAIGNQVKTAVNSFAGSFFMATRPPIIKSYSQQDYEQTEKLFYFSSKVIFILLFVLIVPLFIEIEPILQLWLGRVTDYMPNFVRLMLVYALIVSMSEPITAIVQAAGEVKRYHGIVDIFTLITLPISYVLFKMGGNANWGFFISIIVFIIAHIIRLVILKTFYDISIRRYFCKLVLPIIISIVLITISMFGFFMIIGNYVMIVIAVSVIISLAISWFVVLEKDERDSLIVLVRSKLEK